MIEKTVKINVPNDLCLSLKNQKKTTQKVMSFVVLLGAARSPRFRIFWRK